MAVWVRQRRIWEEFMAEYESVSEDDVLNADIPDEVLERAAGSADIPAWTMNYCTYNFYQCGPIG